MQPRLQLRKIRARRSRTLNQCKTRTPSPSKRIGAALFAQSTPSLLLRNSGGLSFSHCVLFVFLMRKLRDI
ncbi:hypothetical protein RchiOBHm_Chr2g0143701 [Rosa chinensis]|uniref:Uncharacterized protein n=1 Tax=Rosa chinensis TaxID=74649 RepID=A0A2P6RY69_ROSCH|nr:hypothetical protein RchiOBHm_Chr2g0143701 [Rosa chinensis]